jgi:protein Mpv17
MHMQFVYWGYISNAMYLAAMGALQGHSPEQIYDKIKTSLWGLMIAQWVFWIPVQAVNFQFVPVRHQLNVVLTISIIWTALLSFWYPPEPKPTPIMIEQDPDKLNEGESKKE